MRNSIFLISNICLGISLALGLISWKYLDKALRILTIQLGLALFTQVAGRVYISFYTNNTFIYNIYIFLDLWIVGQVAFYLIKDKVYRRILLIGEMICTGIIAACIWKMGINVLANWGYLSSCILFTMTYLFLIVQMLFSADATLLIKRSHFWVCMGVLIYYGCNVPLFGFFNYMIKNHPAVASKTVVVNDFLNIVRYLLMGFAIYKQRQLMQQKQVLLS